MSNYTYIGIDVAKHSLCCSLPDRKPFSVSNSPAGIRALVRRATAIDEVNNLRFVMESTGGYSDYTADALTDLAGAESSIVPPARINGYKQAEHINTKNDPSDAGLIRRFAEKHHPALRLPPTPAQRHLRCLHNQMNGLHKAMAQQRCIREKLASAYRPDTFALESVARTISFLKQELARLQAEFDRTVAEDETMAADAAHMLSIPGIGAGVCNVMLTVCYHQLRELSAGKLLKQCGMEPREFQSGINKGHTRMSKAGDGRVRAVLYMAALASVGKDRLMYDYFQAQKAAGKPGKVALVNVMRRLLFLIQGVVRSNSPFDIEIFRARG